MKKDDLENDKENGKMKKDRLEILWKDMQRQFDLVLEGQAALITEMRNMRKEFSEKQETIHTLLGTLGTD
jgi:hypothetical protein